MDSGVCLLFDPPCFARAVPLVPSVQPRPSQDPCRWPRLTSIRPSLTVHSVGHTVASRKSPTWHSLTTYTPYTLSPRRISVGRHLAWLTALCFVRPAAVSRGPRSGPLVSFPLHAFHSTPHLQSPPFLASRLQLLCPSSSVLFSHRSAQERLSLLATPHTARSFKEQPT